MLPALSRGTHPEQSWDALRVTEPWPRLPSEAVESPSLEIFQPRLDAVLCPLLWVTLLGQGVGLGDPQRSLPTPAMLGFCEQLTGRGPCLSRVSMTEVEPVLDFASSGRTGRRNALPDILGSPAGLSPAELPLKLAEMSLSAGRSWARWGTTRDGQEPRFFTPSSLLAGSAQEMRSPSAEVPPPQPPSPELKDTS